MTGFSNCHLRAGRAKRAGQRYNCLNTCLVLQDRLECSPGECRPLLGGCSWKVLKPLPDEAHGFHLLAGATEHDNFASQLIHTVFACACVIWLRWLGKLANCPKRVPPLSYRRIVAKRRDVKAGSKKDSHKSAPETKTAEKGTGTRVWRDASDEGAVHLMHLMGEAADGRKPKTIDPLRRCVVAAPVCWDKVSIGPSLSSQHSVVPLAGASSTRPADAPP